MPRIASGLLLLEDNFLATPRFREAELPLRSGTDNYLVHINIGRLFDRERNSAGDRIGRHRELVSGRGELGFHLRICTRSAKFVRTKPGEMIVTRSLSPASWRKPSEMARTANFVPK